MVRMHTVFAQTTDANLPLAVLARNAELHFDSSVALADASPASGGATAYRARYTTRADGEGEYLVEVRPSTKTDFALALEAETRGAAAGMAALAARCAHVWLVRAEGSSPEWLTWEFCALLALTALGPILPPDHSTLLGVRGARARSASLRAAP